MVGEVGCDSRSGGGVGRLDGLDGAQLVARDWVPSG